MNIINLHKNSNCDFSRIFTYSKPNSSNTKYDTVVPQSLNRTEKKSNETRKPIAYDTFCNTDYIDKKMLLNQSEMENLLSANQIPHSSKAEICSEMSLTDDQEAALRIMRILGVKLKNKVNWDSDGTGQLTATQIKDLKARYNVSRLDINEHCNLLVELVNLNVLSSDDLVKQFVHEIPPEVVKDGCLVYSSKTLPSLEPGSIFEQILLKNQMLDDLIQAIDDRNTTINESGIDKARRFYDKEKKRSQKIVDIFELLKG